MLMQAVWWKPRDVFISDTTIHPLTPFEPYNPFVHYHPRTRKETTRSAKSLYYEFLRVDGNDVQAVSQFCRTYGMLGRLDNPGWIAWGMEKSGSEDFLNAVGSNEPSPFGLLYEHDQRGARLRHVVGIPPDSSLCVPMEWDDFKKAQTQLREATEWASIIASKRKPKERATAQTALNQRFRWKLSMVRPNVSMDIKERKSRFSWDIGSLEAAFYLMLLSDVCGGGQIRNCKLCGTFFLGITSRGRFCSNRCLNTFKVRSFRARKKGVSKQPASKEVLDGSSGR